MRIFLDANVLFSASKSAGAVRQLLTLALKQKHVLCADEYVAAEARRNLQAKAAPDSIEMLDTLLTRMEVSPARMDSAESAAIAWLPEKDRPVLVAAIRLQCDILVTGDVAHFGRGFGKRVEGVMLCSPRMLYDALTA